MTSKTEWTRQAEWLKAAGHDDSQQPTPWCRLVRQESAIPVVLMRWGTLMLIDQFARNLIDSGIRYAEIIESAEDPSVEIEWDFLTDIQSSYVYDIVEVHRLADESLPGLIHALVETAGAMGAEWLQRGFGDWTTLVATWPVREIDRTPTPAERASSNLLIAVAARWGLAGNPTPAQAAAIDIEATVARAVENFTRPDHIELIQILVTGAEEIGLAALNTNIRPSLSSTRLAPEVALTVRDNDEPPF